jgi:hypothetical protein
MEHTIQGSVPSFPRQLEATVKAGRDGWPLVNYPSRLDVYFTRQRIFESATPAYYTAEVEVKTERQVDIHQTLKEPPARHVLHTS